MAAADLQPIKRRMGERHVQSLDEVVLYLQRTVHPELSAIRAYLDQLGPCIITLQSELAVLQSAARYSISFGDNIHAGQPVPGASYTHLTRLSLASFDRKCRVTFNAGAFPAVIGEKDRSVYLEFWSGATGAGGSPELALFNDDVPEEITGTATLHTLGTTSEYHLVGPILVGAAAGALPVVEAKYSIQGRDTAVVTTPLIEQARFLVRYE